MPAGHTRLNSDDLKLFQSRARGNDREPALVFFLELVDAQVGRENQLLMGVVKNHSKAPQNAAADPSCNIGTCVRKWIFRGKFRDRSLHTVRAKLKFLRAAENYIFSAVDLRVRCRNCFQVCGKQVIRLRKSVSDHNRGLQRRVHHEFTLARLLSGQRQFRANQRHAARKPDGETRPVAGIFVNAGIVEPHRLPAIINFHHNRAQKIPSKRSLITSPGLSGEIFLRECRQ